MKDAKPAIVAGELAKSFDPAVSEWDNPVMRDHDDPALGREGNRGN